MSVGEVRRSTEAERRLYGVEWRTHSAWRTQPTVGEMANMVRKRIGPQRTRYIEQYAQALGITLDEAKRKLKAQKRSHRPTSD
jgi:hypothetical protein